VSTAFIIFFLSGFSNSVNSENTMPHLGEFTVEWAQVGFVWRKDDVRNARSGRSNGLVTTGSLGNSSFIICFIQSRTNSSWFSRWRDTGVIPTHSPLPACQRYPTWSDRALIRSGDPLLWDPHPCPLACMCDVWLKEIVLTG